MCEINLQFLELAIVNNMNKEESYNVSDLYATVDKNKSKKFKNYEESKDAFPLYSVVNKKSATKGKNLEENRDSVDLYATVDKSRKNRDLQTTEQNNIYEDEISPIESKIQTKLDNYKVDCTKSFKNSLVAKTTLINIIWSVTVAIMTMFIVAFVVTTAIGFTKVSNQPPQFLSNKYNQNIASPTPSTVVMDSSTTVNLPSLNISASPSPSTQEMKSSTTPSINVILLNHSHLQDLFDANDILLQFFNYCNSRGNLTQTQCADSALRIYGKNKIVPAKAHVGNFYPIVPQSSVFWLLLGESF